MEKTDNTHTIVCNYAAYGKEDCLRLNLWGARKGKVVPDIEVIKGLFAGGIPDRFLDFIEIATYVYCADQMVVRCQGRVDPQGALWRRHFRMVVAVREPAFWSRQEVKACLERLLWFLGDERYSFTFVPLTYQPPDQLYLKIKPGKPSEKPLDRVMLFSGGVDSLGGAIQEAIVEGRRVALVRHKSNSKFKYRYKALEDGLAKKCQGNEPVYITVKVGKDSELTKEYTQRTRSFLYFALGATVAHMLKLNEVRFYENGPVSLNLPLSPQVLGGRRPGRPIHRRLQDFKS